MRVYVKTLKNTNFPIQVEPHYTIADVKKIIENVQGRFVYPAEQQLLIYQGKVLKNGTTILNNEVAEDSFIVVMLSKIKASSSKAPTPKVSPATQTPSVIPSTTDPLAPASQEPPAAPMETYTYEQAAANAVAGNKFEKAVQNILEFGEGAWDRAMVVRAMHAAFNNPERAVEYLYSGIPEEAEAATAIPPLSSLLPTIPASQPVNAAPIPSGGGPNTNSLDLFPQGLSNMGSEIASAGTLNLDLLPNHPRFRELQAAVQANPAILQPLLQQLGREDPQILRFIEENRPDLLRLLNVPTEGGERDWLGDFENDSVSQSMQMTPEDDEAIARLEAMGFERALVVQVFIACNKNEELAANRLLDIVHED